LRPHAASFGIACILDLYLLRCLDLAHCLALLSGAAAFQRDTGNPLRRQNTAISHPRDNTITFRSGPKKGMQSHTDPHHALHHHEEVELWKKITGVGSIFVAGVFLNWLASCVPPRARSASIRVRPVSAPVHAVAQLNLPSSPVLAGSTSTCTPRRHTRSCASATNPCPGETVARIC
jgi:hypothetical protein